VLIPENHVLIWDNQRMVHARSAYTDKRRHLTRYWIAAQR
jgi:alpha-ketoglutarate-dependent taurine dioxygenase